MYASNTKMHLLTEFLVSWHTQSYSQFIECIATWNLVRLSKNLRYQVNAVEGQIIPVTEIST